MGTPDVHWAKMNIPGPSLRRDVAGVMGERLARGSERGRPLNGRPGAVMT